MESRWVCRKSNCSARNTLEGEREREGDRGREGEKERESGRKVKSN